MPNGPFCSFSVAIQLRCRRGEDLFYYANILANFLRDPLRKVNAYSTARQIVIPWSNRTRIFRVVANKRSAATRGRFLFTCFATSRSGFRAFFANILLRGQCNVRCVPGGREQHRRPSARRSRRARDQLESDS